MKTMTVVEMARLGGLARGKKISKRRRVDIAKKAANTRWGNIKKNGKS